MNKKQIGSLAQLEQKWSRLSLSVRYGYFSCCVLAIVVVVNSVRGF